MQQVIRVMSLVFIGSLAVVSSGCWIGAHTGVTKTDETYESERNLDESSLLGVHIEPSVPIAKGLGFSAEGGVTVQVSESGTGENEQEGYEAYAGATWVPPVLLSDDIFKPYVAAGASWSWIQGTEDPSASTTGDEVEYEAQDMLYYIAGGINLEFMDSIRVGARARYRFSPNETEYENETTSETLERVRQEEWQFFVSAAINF